MLLPEALFLFLQVDRSSQTRDTYRKFLTRFVTDIGRGRPLDLVTPADLDAYVLEMRAKGTKYADHPTRPTIHRPLAPTTVHKNVQTIKTFFQWCVDRGYLELSPARFLSNRRPVRPIGQGKAATDQEVEAILRVAQGNRRDYALVILIAQSGCRAGEAASLTIQDLDLPNGSALITGKGAKQRQIYFGPEVAEAIRAWLAVRPNVGHDGVFISTRGHGPLTAQSVSQIFRRLCKLAGVRSLGAHSFRHWVGQKMARAHIAPRVTQHYLGHSDVVTTLSYYQDVNEDDLREAGRLLAPQPKDRPEEAKEKPAAAKILRFRRSAG